MVFVLFVLAGILVLILASGIYIFLVACVRKKELLWLVEDEIRKTSYGKYYEHIISANRWLNEHHAEDVFITSKDGLKLHGLWVPATDPVGTIILAHGYRSTYLVDFGLVFDFYHEYGLNILIPEQRSHGQSQGKFITFGVRESDDILQWINYHNEQYGTLPIILSGLSMGASTVMYVADRDLPENVKGIIADCGFTSPKDIISSVFKRVIHLPPAPSLWVTDLLARLFANFSLTEKDTRKILARNRLPILMVHGTEDNFVPCSMTKEAYAACSGQKKILLVEGADHGVSFLVDRQRYTELVVKFLNQIFKGQKI